MGQKIKERLVQKKWSKHSKLSLYAKLQDNKEEKDVSRKESPST